MEMFRDLGIEDRVMRRAMPQDLMGKQVFATASPGASSRRMMTWGTGEDRRADYAAASPCAMCNAPQHVLEPILLDAARVVRCRHPLRHEVVASRRRRSVTAARARARRRR